MVLLDVILVAMGLSNQEIADSLEISVETVKEHVQNLLRKISVSDRTQAAVWCCGTASADRGTLQADRVRRRVPGAPLRTAGGQTAVCYDLPHGGRCAGPPGSEMT